MGRVSPRQAQSSTMLSSLLSALAVLVVVSFAQEDPCYREDINCHRPGENGLGTIPYFPDIWACELACRDTAGCNWFTWFENPGFYNCYLLTSCNDPRGDERAISGKVEDCSPDTTPTKFPPWTSPHAENN